MSKTAEAPTQNRVIDLKSGAHMMVLDAGVFCIFHAAGQPDPGPAGLPGVRISRAPGTPPGIVTVSTFEEDGWIGGANGAALVRITRGPAAVLVTTYQEPGSQHDAPKLQVAQLAGPTSVSPASVAVAQPAQKSADLPTGPAEISAHVQRVGDVAAPIGEWMGTPGSQSWIEGFAIAPKNSIPASDIEYQAVLGKGWLSPWSEGGQYCGSRGMALPILGLRVRLKGASAETHHIRLSSTFTDGSRLGPLDGTDALEAESLAPLEAFLLEIIPNDAAAPPTAKSEKAPRAKSTKAPAKRKSASAD
ncbi:hypothetical protein AD940_13140 [Gluconobacter thailandicus]|uniref:hypothetical protein n=1 Tax=Gluconobacter thailandicus TaxID=257438 RepID=UPI0007780670|nr:hypothetical protein [Gluconobacter thailandicus]KXV32905.1 hypothetical protein AD940_13140 [Gluconobacter thailandicus]